LLEAQSSAKDWIVSRTYLLSSARNFQSKLQKIADFETENSWERYTWNVLKKAVNLTCACVTDLYIIQAHLIEPFNFFGGLCLESTKHLVNGAKSVISSDKHSNKEKHETTKNIAQEWDCYKNIKAQLMLRHLENFASNLSQQVT
jgi:hypothetical protein